MNALNPANPYDEFNQVPDTACTSFGGNISTALATDTFEPSDAVIFDIDGTLADLTHRLHYIQGTKRDYKSFFNDMSGDKRIDDIYRLYRMMQWRSGSDVIIVTGRPDSHRSETVNWLLSNGIFSWSKLYMRKSGDTRADHIIKGEILHDILADGYRPWLAIDDRDSIVDMWRANGITTLQCAKGDFCPMRSDFEGKTLLHLMVEPSGAGKSTWLSQNVTPGSIVSSDEIRQSITGDTGDQSRNDDVFSALHDVVRSRLRNGLQTYVDATNIRRKDRLSIVSLAPAGSNVEYIVVNRSMDDKVRDGGLRNLRVNNGVPLMQKHEQTFKSQIKDIMAGDYLDHVIVTDRRA